MKGQRDESDERYCVRDRVQVSTDRLAMHATEAEPVASLETFNPSFRERQ